MRVTAPVYPLISTLFFHLWGSGAPMAASAQSSFDQDDDFPPECYRVLAPVVSCFSANTCDRRCNLQDADFVYSSRTYLLVNDTINQVDCKGVNEDYCAMEMCCSPCTSELNTLSECVFANTRKDTKMLHNLVRIGTTVTTTSTTTPTALTRTKMTTPTTVTPPTVPTTTTTARTCLLLTTTTVTTTVLTFLQLIPKTTPPQATTTTAPKRLLVKTTTTILPLVTTTHKRLLLPPSRQRLPPHPRMTRPRDWPLPAL